MEVGAVATDDRFHAAREAFHQTINLKLEQLYTYVRKGSNPDLTGKYIEELVRGFIRDWISPCQLLHGTLFPHDFNPAFDQPPKPKQIDGIIFDPRKGPPVIREGGFVVTHPAFCHGIIEIKTSEPNLRDLQNRLTALHRQYFVRGCLWKSLHEIMGIVIHDPDPEKHSQPDWLSPSGSALHEIGRGGHCPIFILFKQAGDSFEPFTPAIDAMLETIFAQGLGYDPRLDDYIRLHRIDHQMMMRY
jgi:hypothetical protein